MNVAALVAYDGTRFVGFQRQPSDRGLTVQGEIEAALRRVAGEPVAIEAAGRTDSGVHATGQVISFAVAARASLADAATWQRALNAQLPEDIAVRAAGVVSDDFRARWSALSRSYRYRMLIDTVRSPLRERYAWRVGSGLDVAAMAEAAAILLGEHDFGAFGSSPRDRPREGYRGHTVRTMLEAQCARSEQDADEIVCDFTANGFLSSMVRQLVGTLMLVGAGRLSVAGFRAILETRDKSHPGAAAPARGLCLTRVAYPVGTLPWQ